MSVEEWIANAERRSNGPYHYEAAMDALHDIGPALAALRAVLEMPYLPSSPLWQSGTTKDSFNSALHAVRQAIAEALDVSASLVHCCSALECGFVSVSVEEHGQHCACFSGGNGTSTPFVHICAREREDTTHGTG